VPTTKAVNEYIIKPTGFSPVFEWKKSQRSDGVYPQAKNTTEILTSISKLFREKSIQLWNERIIFLI
jgi:hypothetical protein